MRSNIPFDLEDVSDFKSRLLQWSRNFETVVWMDGNGHADVHSSYDVLLAVGARSSLQVEAHGAFTALEAYRKDTQDWIFGYLSYDLKNDVEQLESQNPDGLEFPELWFFQPVKLIAIKSKKAYFMYSDQAVDAEVLDWNAIMALKQGSDTVQEDRAPIQLSPRIGKSVYLERVNQLLWHIHRGDVYEVNFCQEFFAEGAQIDPWATYTQLNAISTPPFAVFLRNGSRYLLSASPERYLKREGDWLISQPIKGTAPRDPDPIRDRELREVLEADPKERSENIMIVDLVRNDLSHHAQKGSVAVSDLCEARTYAQVHQLVSTVQAKLRPGIGAVQPIRDSFPMGSMTGAPKISAMELIEKLESFKRGLYSGAVGYFDPQGNFDFNVVIRSVLYHAGKQYVSCSVGGAITAMAKPEQEYRECMLKVAAMRKVLEGDIPMDS